MLKIKGFRVMLGLTQKEMAERLNLSLKSYSNKEKGLNEFTLSEVNTIYELVKEKQPNIKYEEIFFNN